MGVSSDVQRVSDLRFRVFARALHPEWFRTMAHRRIVRTGWSCDLRIIPGGHVLCWASGPARLTEVLAVRDEELPEAGERLAARVGPERSVRIGIEPGVVHQACVSVERLAPDLFGLFCEELTLDARRALFARHASSNRLIPAALSSIRAEAIPRGLSIHAVHTFPHECAVVRAQTLIEVEPDA